MSDERKTLEQILAEQDPSRVIRKFSDPPAEAISEKTVKTLAMMVVTLARRLPETDPARAPALEYLVKHKLISPLREPTETPT